MEVYQQYPPYDNRVMTQFKQNFKQNYDNFGQGHSRIKSVSMTQNQHPQVMTFDNKQFIDNNSDREDDYD